MKKIALIFSMFAAILLVSAKEISILNYDSYGAVKFGEKLQNVEKLLKEKSIKDRNDEDGCYFVSFKSYPNVSFMVEDGIVVRADIDINIPTIFNIPVSYKLKEIKSKYPSVEIGKHFYAEKGYYLTFSNLQNTKTILYEYYNNKIQMIRGGLSGPVGAVEGCS